MTHPLVSSEVERRTQELGRQILQKAQSYRASFEERLQDGIMVRLMKDERLKTRLLRFVDVLEALDFDPKGVEVKRLAQEYFDEPFPSLPGVIRFFLKVGLKGPTPPRLVAGAARQLARFVAR